MAKSIPTGHMKMRRANAPGRVAAQRATATPAEGATTNPMCEWRHTLVTPSGAKVNQKCDKRSTVLRKWRWWCDAHAPANEPGEGCRHDITSPLFGVETCSFCGWAVDRDA